MPCKTMANIACLGSLYIRYTPCPENRGEQLTGTLCRCIATTTENCHTKNPQQNSFTLDTHRGLVGRPMCKQTRRKKEMVSHPVMPHMSAWVCLPAGKCKNSCPFSPFGASENAKPWKEMTVHPLSPSPNQALVRFYETVIETFACLYFPHSAKSPRTRPCHLRLSLLPTRPLLRCRSPASFHSADHACQPSRPPYPEMGCRVAISPREVDGTGRRIA